MGNTKECCDKKNLINFSGKVSDMFGISIWDGIITCKNGVPKNIGLGDGGDYVTFSYCANCGQMMGNFPLSIKYI